MSPGNIFAEPSARACCDTFTFCCCFIQFSHGVTIHPALFPINHLGLKSLKVLNLIQEEFENA